MLSTFHIPRQDTETHRQLCKAVSCLVVCIVLHGGIAMCRNKRFDVVVVAVCGQCQWTREIRTSWSDWSDAARTAIIVFKKMRWVLLDSDSQQASLMPGRFKSPASPAGPLEKLEELRRQEECSNFPLPPSDAEAFGRASGHHSLFPFVWRNLSHIKRFKKI